MGSSGAFFTLCRCCDLRVFTLQCDLCNVKDLVMEIIRDPGRGVPLVKVVFRDTYKLKLRKEPIVAVEDTHTGRFVFCGAEAE